MGDQIKLGECLIEHEGDEKYIMVKVTQGEGAPILHLVSMPLAYHSDIAKAYKRRLAGEGKKIEVRGGGILTIDRSKKKIKTYGMSFGFGAPNIDDVRSVLEKNFWGWQLEVTVTSEIRG
eukprot:TRINITY_DN8973_c0_g1_i1.p1 TRINITY_DN8973_c0_g1~~TRINITY_DN8973_c0_g1_i1.p1  ORF type:complete len:120 (-),score=27.65 TRINITY_DN8973_c0_g1_i1:360-719(-)